MRSEIDSIAPPSSAAIERLLRLDVPAPRDDRPVGYPSVTPFWFDWRDDAFYVARSPDAPHARNLRLDPNASIRVE